METFILQFPLEFTLNLILKPGTRTSTYLPDSLFLSVLSRISSSSSFLQYCEKYFVYACSHPLDMAIS